MGYNLYQFGRDRRTAELWQLKVSVFAFWKGNSMNVAFIPVRGGSKSIKLKNIKLLNGKPLVYWTLKAACGCSCIDRVYVATDSSEISDAVKELCLNNSDGLFSKVEIIGRSAESATDNASTEFAMLEFASLHEFDNIVLIQATSPLLKSSDLARGFEEFYKDGTDSVLSVVRQKRFCWELDDSGFAKPVNYDVSDRPRRQEFEGYLVENGAFYITSRTSLIDSHNRVSGNIRVVEMDSGSYYEIDEPDDWTVVEALMKSKTDAVTKKIPEIKMLITDCDGCLTDCGMYYSEHGDELKKFNTRDGMAFALLREKGVITGIITSESVDLNKRRASKLKLDILEEGCKDKLETIKRICRQWNIDLENVCYIGDDINDIDALKAVGYGCCPNDAISGVKAVSDYIAEAKGGEGVVREIADQLIINVK